VGEGVFLEGIPDSRVGASSGEMVAFFGGGCGFGGDYGGEDVVDGGEEGGVGEKVLEYEDAWAGEKGVVPFILEGGGEGLVGDVVSGEVVDRDVGGDGGGERVVGRVCILVGEFL
jgi:hypothetical protein